MGDNLLDDLYGLSATEVLGSEGFLAELSYYSSLPEVSVDPQVKEIYNQKARIATSAKRMIKSDKSSITSYDKVIRETKSSNDERRIQYKDEIRELARQRREARKKLNSSKILSDEAKQARQTLRSVKRQKATKKKHYKRNVEKSKENLNESIAKLNKKKAEIAEQTKKLMKSTNYMKKLELGIRSQFKEVDKILALRDSIKAGEIDLNAPENARA